MPRTKSPVVCVLLVFWTLHLTAGEPGFPFLRIGLDARSTGMADANYAQYGDPATVFLNPAGTGKLEHRSVMAGYTDYLRDVSGGFAVYSQPVNGIGILGGGFAYFDYGSFDGYDNLGIPTKSFGASDLSVFVFGARQIDAQTYAGVTLKYIASSIERYKASAFALDFGTVYEPQDNIYVGASLTNIGIVTDQFDARNERLPWAFQVGIAKKFTEVPVLAEVDLNELNRKGNFFNKWSLGAEWRPVSQLAVRAGYNNLRRSDAKGGDGSYSTATGLSLGFGFTAGEYNFDYSIAGQGIGLVNRFTIRMQI